VLTVFAQSCGGCDGNARLEKHDRDVPTSRCRCFSRSR